MAMVSATSRESRRKRITSPLYGVDIVWLNPVYRSPNKDNGYDISDYEEVMEEFGTMADLDRLVAALHNRGIRVVMDLVVNQARTSIPGSGTRAPRSCRRSATGTSGGPAGRAALPTTGRPASAGAPGSSTPRPASTTSTSSIPASPTSTGRTPSSGRRSTP